MDTKRLSDVIVATHPGYTVTTFADGTSVTALHAEQRGQAQTAQDLGLESAVAMNEEHDLLHSQIAHMLGLPHSPTLWDVAHGRPADDLHFLEEKAVLAVQSFAAAARRKLLPKD